MNGTYVTTELYTLSDGRRVFAYHVGSASFYGYGYSLKEAWQEANTLFENALAHIESEMDTADPRTPADIAAYDTGGIPGASAAQDSEPAAPKAKLPRVFPDEVFMPDDHIPGDEY